MTSKATLALSMIVKNEIQSLGRCLDSARGIVDEIVIADTGSTDGTLELARARADRVIETPWNDSFAEARNVALSQVRADWVLWLDADEVLRSGSEMGLRKAISDIRAIAWQLPIHNHTSGDVRVHHMVRLFRRLEGVTFHGRLHEGVTESLEPIFASNPTFFGGRSRDVVIDHYGYEPDMMQARSKKDRNVRLLRLMLAEEPESPQILYDLARALETGDESDQAVFKAAHLLMDLSRSGRGRIPVTPDVLTVAAQRWMQRGAIDQALRVCEMACAECEDHPATRLILGWALLEMGEVAQAREHIERALSMPSPEAGFYYDVRDHAISGRILRARALQKEGLENEALMDLKKLREQFQGAARPVYALVEMLSSGGKHMAAMREALAWMRDHPSDARCLALCADVAEKLGEHETAAAWRAKLVGPSVE